MDYELEQARLYAGFSSQDWNNLGGSHIWVYDGGYCKADYLVLYRVNNRIQSVGEDIRTRHVEKETRKSQAKRTGKHR